MRYDVDSGVLRASADTIEQVLAQVQSLGIADELRPVASAIPGGRCATGLHQVAAAWQARLASTRWELRELGRCMSMAADGYDAVDAVAQDALGRAEGVRR